MQPVQRTSSTPPARKPGEPVAELPRPRLAAAADASADGEIRRLASVIEKNRSAIAQGWREIDRLTRQLAFLESLKTLHPPKPRPSSQLPSGDQKKAA